MPTPQEIEMFLSSMGDDTLAKDLERQIAEARALRGYQNPAFTSAGGTTVANVPGAISAMFMRGQGDQREKAAQTRQDEMAEKQRKITAEYFNKVFGTQGAAPAATGYGPQPFKDGGVV